MIALTLILLYFAMAAQGTTQLVLLGITAFSIGVNLRAMRHWF